MSFLLLLMMRNISADPPKSRPDSHAPIGVMGEHAHKASEVMLSYRFMAMEMRGLQSGITALATTDVRLHDDPHTNGNADAHARSNVRTA